MKTAEIIKNKMVEMYDEKQSSHLSRFFKTGKGEYGEGDKFLGIKVPETRLLVKQFKKDVSLEDIEILISSEWHEIRLAGFLLLVELYKMNKKNHQIAETSRLVEFYIANISRGNNWDLVDLIAEHILGDWLLTHTKDRLILQELSESDSLWHQRVAIVSTFMLIKHGEYKDTFKIAKQYINHNHDLIHKATGWMLREIGKRIDEILLLAFLDENASGMPRTMLRYSIERLSPEKRIYYLKLK